MIKYAVDFQAPVAVRYPKGEAYDGLKEYRAPVSYGKSEMIHMGREIALVAVGSMVKTAVSVEEALKQRGYEVTLINARFVKPLDEEMLLQLLENHRLIVTMEENVFRGGFGEAVNDFYQNQGASVKVLNIAIPDRYIEHGSIDILKKEAGIDAESVVKAIEELV